MPKIFTKFFLRCADWIGNIRQLFTLKIGAILSFVFSFVLVFSCLYVTAQSGIMVKKIRKSLPEIITSLNEVGVDLAYDNIKFNPVAFFPLMKIDNPQLYSLDERQYWNLQFDNIKIYTNLLGSPQLQIKFADHGAFSHGNTLYETTSGKTILRIDDLLSQPEFLIRSEKFNIKNLALFNNITFWLKPSNLTEQTAKGLPFYQSLLEINNVTINGMVNYPLSSYIKNISAKADIIGKFSFDDDLLTSAESWVKNGGFMDVPQLIVQWAPLTLVGRGNVHLNGNLQPTINFNTSSKGLLKLIKSLQEISFINSSNVYVANILLSNKAFRLNPEDEELTITTPISYSDGKISIENLVIKDFDKETQQ